MDIKFSTDLASYDSFWDWFLHVRNPFDVEKGHFHWEPTFFSNELEFYLLAMLTFTHAYRHGARYLWLWFAILWHGYTVELVSYWFETIDNFWHAQSTLMFFGRREPFQIVLVYPSYLYCAAIVVERMGVSELTQACTMALMVVILDFPYDIMGIKNLWWTWHDTDSNLFDRNYWVPITSYYFHATFACSFSLIYNKARRYFVGLSGVYGEDDLHHSGNSFGRRTFMAGNFWGEFKAAACAGLFSMPAGILQFIPLFHYFRDVHHLHAEPTMIALGGIYLLVAFFGVNRAKPRNMLEEGEREERKGSKKFGKGRWYYDEIVAAVLIHFFHYILLVTFSNPKTYQVYGLHQTMGSEAGSGDEWDCAQTRNVTYPYPFTPAAFPWFLKSDLFQNVTVTKRPYLCPYGKMLFDEGVFNFECEKGRNQPWVPGNKFYWICGTDWNNDNKGPETSHAEYIFVIYACCILGIHALIQPLIYPRTVFEQFFVKREFPKYWKYDKPSEHQSPRDNTEDEDECDRFGGRIVGVEANPVSGETEVLLRRRRRNGQGRSKSRDEEGAASVTRMPKDDFIAMPVGRIYAERGGEYGVMHDTYNKSSIDRLRTFLSWQASTSRLEIYERARRAEESATRVRVRGIDYSKGYPRPASGE